MAQNTPANTVATARGKANIEVDLVIAEMAAKLREAVAQHGLYNNEVIHGSLALARLVAAKNGAAPTEAAK